MAKKEGKKMKCYDMRFCMMGDQAICRMEKCPPIFSQAPPLEYDLLTKEVVISVKKEKK